MTTGVLSPELMCPDTLFHRSMRPCGDVETFLVLTAAAKGAETEFFYQRQKRDGNCRF